MSVCHILHVNHYILWFCSNEGVLWDICVSTLRSFQRSLLYNGVLPWQTKSTFILSIICSKVPEYAELCRLCKSCFITLHFTIIPRIKKEACINDVSSIQTCCFVYSTAFLHLAQKIPARSWSLAGMVCYVGFFILFIM